MTDGLVQHITVEESTGIQWIKEHFMLDKNALRRAVTVSFACVSLFL